MVESNWMKFARESSSRHMSNDSTVAVLLGRPVPPFDEVTAEVVFNFAPAVVIWTVTLSSHAPPGGMVPPERLTTDAPAAAVNVPPALLDGFGTDATFMPDGRLSVNPTPSSGTLALGLVRVKVKVVVPPIGTNGAPKALVITGGATTVMDAVLLGSPVPPSVETTALVESVWTPAAAPTMVIVIVPDEPAAIVPAVKVIEPAPGAAFIVPPVPLLVAPDGLATFNPAGSGSVNATPVSAIVGFGFEIVNVIDAVPPSGMVGAPNAIDTAGGASTVSVVLAFVAWCPPFVELTPV